MEIQKAIDGRQPFLNRKRLLAYPWLFMIALWFVVLVNFLSRDGWEGGIRGIFGYDFLVFYSSGLLYHHDIENLYDIETLAVVEESLITPTSLQGGFNVNSYPPYVALLTSIFTIIPFFWSFLVWIMLSILALIIASRWLSNQLMPADLRAMGLTPLQIFVILLSFFPTVLGLQNGQNHAFTLMLVTGALVSTIKHKPISAGILAGLLIYKPHFILGFLIVWLVWKEFKALIAFGVTAGIWVASVVITQGFEPYLDYLSQLSNAFLLPYGLAGYIETTPLALLATALPVDLSIFVMRLSQIVLIITWILLGWAAYKLRGGSNEVRFFILTLASIFPFIASPHVLIYDLIVLAPLFVLTTHLTRSRWLLYGIIYVYLGSIILPPASQWLGLALMGTFPSVMVAGLLWYFYNNRNQINFGKSTIT